MKNFFATILFTCLMLAVYAQNPNLIWAEQIGGNGFDVSNAMTIDADGNIYTTGFFRETVDFDPGISTENLTAVGQEDIYIQKLDANGNFLWAKQMGGSGEDEGLAIITDAGGNVYTTGYFSDIVDLNPGTDIQTHDSEGFKDIYVQKLDANGNFLWAKQMGGSFNDSGHAITTDANGNVYTSGSFRETIDIDPGTSVQNLTSNGVEDIYIQKLDTDGNLIWAKQMGGVFEDVGYAITTDNNGYLYTTGKFRLAVDFDPGANTETLVSEGFEDIFVQKLDLDGNFIWVKQMGGNFNDNGNAITTDVNGNVYTTGYFSGTVDFNTDAGIQNLTSAGAVDIYIHKLAPNGNFIWAKQMGGEEWDEGKAITTDANGNVCTTGSFVATVDFDPNSAVQDLNSIGSTDIFIQKLDADGNYIWAQQIGGTSSDSGTSIATDTNDHVYTTGYFIGTADFAPGSDTQNLSSVGGTDIFIQKLEEGTVSLNEPALNTDVTVYPNPSNGQFNISFGSDLTDIEVTIVDMLGRPIHSSKHQFTDNIGLEIDQPAGMYFIEIRTSEGKTSTTFIIK